MPFVFSEAVESVKTEGAFIMLSSRSKLCNHNAYLNCSFIDEILRLHEIVLYCLHQAIISSRLLNSFEYTEVITVLIDCMKSVPKCSWRLFR